MPNFVNVRQLNLADATGHKILEVFLFAELEYVIRQSVNYPPVRLKYHLEKGSSWPPRLDLTSSKRIVVNISNSNSILSECISHIEAVINDVEVNSEIHPDLRRAILLYKLLDHKNYDGVVSAWKSAKKSWMKRLLELRSVYPTMELHEFKSHACAALLIMLCQNSHPAKYRELDVIDFERWGFSSLVLSSLEIGISPNLRTSSNKKSIRKSGVTVAKNLTMSAFNLVDLKLLYGKKTSMAAPTYKIHFSKDKMTPEIVLTRLVASPIPGQFQQFRFTPKSAEGVLRCLEILEVAEDFHLSTDILPVGFLDVPEIGAWLLDISSNRNLDVLPPYLNKPRISKFPNAKRISEVLSLVSELSRICRSSNIAITYLQIYGLLLRTDLTSLGLINTEQQVMHFLQFHIFQVKKKLLASSSRNMHAILGTFLEYFYLPISKDSHPAFGELLEKANRHLLGQIYLEILETNDPVLVLSKATQLLDICEMHQSSQERFSIIAWNQIRAITGATASSQGGVAEIKNALYQNFVGEER